MIQCLSCCHFGIYSCVRCVVAEVGLDSQRKVKDKSSDELVCTVRLTTYLHRQTELSNIENEVERIMHLLTTQHVMDTVPDTVSQFRRGDLNGVAERAEMARQFLTARSRKLVGPRQLMKRS